MRLAHPLALLALLASTSLVPTWTRTGAETPASDPQQLLEKFRSEREQAVRAKFPPETLARADELARRGEAALKANNLAAAARYLRDARWQLPYLPPGLPAHVLRVLGESRVRHADRVNALAFSPDGSRLASCSRDGTVRVWDLGNGRETAVYRGHMEQPDDPTRGGTNVLGVTDVAFHPSDPRVIVSAAGNQVHVWDPTTGEAAKTLLNLGKTDKPIKSLAFSPDGKFLAVGADDGILRVVQFDTGKLTFVGPSRNARIEKVAYSPNGNLIAVADSNSQVAVYAPTKPNALVMTVAGVDHGEVLGVAFSPDSGAVFTCGRDGKARLIAGPKPDGTPAGNTATRLRDYVGHDKSVTSLATVEGGLLVTGGEDTTVRVWDVASARQLRLFQGHMTRVTAVAARSDGKQVASASEDGAIRIWDLNTEDEHQAFSEATDSLWAVAFSPDGKRVASAGADRIIRVYNPETGKRETVLEGAKAPITSLCFLPDSNRLVAAGGDQVVVVWDVNTGKRVQELAGHNSAILAAAATDDGKRVVTGSADRTVRGFDLDANKSVWVWSGRSAVCSVAIRKGGKHVAAGLADGTLVVLNVPDGSPTGAPKEVSSQTAHVAGVASLAFSRDGSRLASVGGDGSLRVWTVADEGTLSQLARFDGRSRPGTPAPPLTGVAFSPDSRFVAAVGADMIVRVWDVQTKSEVRGLRGHTDWVTSVAFSPDGRYLASVGVEKDHSLRIFELPALEVSSRGGHSLAVNAVAVSPDGKRVATAGTDQTIKIWDLATGREVSTLVGNADTPYALAFLGNDSVVMGGSLPTRDSGRFHLWNIGLGQLIRSVPTGEVYSVVASADGSRLAVWASRPAVGETVKNNTYELYNTSGELLVSVSDRGRNIRSATFSPDLTWALAGDDQGTIRIWEIAKKERVRDDWPLFANAVGDLGITPDKKLLIAGDEKGLVKVADVTKREVLGSVTAHKSGFRALLVSPTGKTFVTVSNDREVRCWSLSPNALQDMKPVRSWVLPVGVNAVAYAPAGNSVVTANADGTAYVLEIPEPTK